jgi:hypothetical protein
VTSSCVLISNAFERRRESRRVDSRDRESRTRERHIASRARDASTARRRTRRGIEKRANDRIDCEDYIPSFDLIFAFRAAEDDAVGRRDARRAIERRRSRAR